jgi:hypothetical protein
MQYVMFIVDSRSKWGSPEEQAANYEKIGAWFAEQGAAGNVKLGNELQPAQTAKTVRIAGEQVTVTDGPFMESKEVIGGYTLIEADTIEQAVEIAKTWPITTATLEVRPTVYHAEA